MLKRLARRAGVEEQKVYPHNFRHLFACSYYDINRDIAHLADLLGHSNVEPTRRYTLETVQAEEETLERMGLI
jgi:integrase